MLLATKHNVIQETKPLVEEANENTTNTST